MDVRDLLARLLESLLRLVRPDAEPASPPPFPAETAVTVPRPAGPARPHTAVLRGEDTALVRTCTGSRGAVAGVLLGARARPAGEC
ncbi:hypothetical protein QMZ92_09365 [Streptomyces sp. HNM0645]|uniref:hypothetical protein n=1 Tax=Streptomyces sp. HNM0645 TaxID=2782343 RepID=UPI0024B7CD78|nr:hypothetical protein [Streptomyces sp. HNM0645]MDI9884601.1 hypothetical protein [Streptomyces sp. HNM0645]